LVAAFYTAAEECEKSGEKWSARSVMDAFTPSEKEDAKALAACFLYALNSLDSFDREAVVSIYRSTTIQQYHFAAVETHDIRWQTTAIKTQRDREGIDYPITCTNKGCSFTDFENYAKNEDFIVMGLSKDIRCPKCSKFLVTPKSHRESNRS
jgi:hypothetical protein